MGKAHPEDAQRFLQTVERALATGEPSEQPRSRTGRARGTVSQRPLSPGGVYDVDTDINKILTKI
jgi:hypothetical protein